MPKRSLRIRRTREPIARLFERECRCREQHRIDRLRIAFMDTLCHACCQVAFARYATGIPLSHARIHRIAHASRCGQFRATSIHKKFAICTCSPQRILITMNVRDLPFDFDLESRKDCREMIHYICDLCKCEIDPKHESSYVVRMEVYPRPLRRRSPDRRRSRPSRRLHEVLERYDEFEADGALLGQRHLSQKAVSILCRQCCKRFLQEPLGRACRQRFELSKP